MVNNTFSDITQLHQCIQIMKKEKKKMRKEKKKKMKKKRKKKKNKNKEKRRKRRRIDTTKNPYTGVRKMRVFAYVNKQMIRSGGSTSYSLLQKEN